MISRDAKFVLVLVTALTGCGANPRASADRAAKDYAAHDFLAARADLGVALAAFPDDQQLIELSARTSLGLGDGYAADAALHRLSANRQPSDFGLLLGEAALLRGDANAALTSVGQDRSARAARVRALAHMVKHDTTGAESAFAAGISANPRDASLLAAFGRFRLMQGDAAGARALVDRALAADRGALDALLSDAQVSTAEGKLDRALAAYVHAVKAYPGNLAAMSGKAAVLGDLGQIDEMDAVLATITTPDAQGTVTYLRARAASARGHWAQTRAILEPLEAKPSAADGLLDGGSGEHSADAAILYAQALTELGQPQQASARLLPMLRRYPLNLAVRRALARAQLAGNDPAGATTTLRALAYSPFASADDLRLLAKAARAANDPDLATYEARARFPAPRALGLALADGDTAMRAGNWGNAIRAYDIIMAATDGRNPLVLNNLAWAEGQVGNRDKALDYARRAYAVAPHNPSVLDTLGWLMIQSGKDHDRAIALLREALASAPQSRAIQAHLNEALKH